MALEEALDGVFSGKLAFAFNGTSSFGQGEMARLFVCLFRDETRNEDMIHQVRIEIPISCLPYVPDTGSGSLFARNGYYFYPEAEHGYELVFRQGVPKRITLAGKVIYEAER